MTAVSVGLGLTIYVTDDRLKGVLTGRDVVIKVLGADKDAASTTAGELAQGEAVTIGADGDASEILRTMTDLRQHSRATERHTARRLTYPPTLGQAPRSGWEGWRHDEPGAAGQVQVFSAAATSRTPRRPATTPVTKATAFLLLTSALMPLACR